MIKWHRSDEGFVSSHDEKWQISPLYWGCTTPQCYELRYNNKRMGSRYATQRDAKDAARLKKDKIEHQASHS